ncbi:rCG20695, isoform CRA_d [Rattus norvegicus]|uniref:RCG20695, isoform CRA_d n=1 Tax=Rattus norvegicus TaxID=10116 RepID=A6JEB3_RAT|nr:rCG20695, isoform CRA_d [Rattus norvegicus]
MNYFCFAGVNRNEQQLSAFGTCWSLSWFRGHRHTCPCPDFYSAYRYSEPYLCHLSRLDHKHCKFHLLHLQIHCPYPVEKMNDTK